MTALSKRARTDEGGVTVETALVLPVFLAVAGLAMFGTWLAFVTVAVDRGADAGLRVATTPPAADRTAWPTTDGVAAAVADATPLVTPTAVDVDDATGSPARNGRVVVTVTYEVANPFAAFGGPDTLVVSASSTGRRE